jgi:hypothetical protein
MKIIATILQLFLFLLVFGVFSLFPPLHIQYILRSTTAGTHIFIADGLILALALYLLILLLQAFLKRLPSSAPWTSLAFVLSIFLGLMMRFGFLTRSPY